MAGRPLTTVSRPTSGLESTPTPTGPTFTIDAIADQSGLSPVTLGVTVTASSGSLVYSWTVDGATTGLSDATAAAPTYTPTTGGKHTVACTITDDGGSTVAAPVAFQVGDADGLVTVAVLDGAAEFADHGTDNYKASPSITALDGSAWTFTAGGITSCDTSADGIVMVFPGGAAAADFDVTNLLAMYPALASHSELYVLVETAATDAAWPTGAKVTIRRYNTGANLRTAEIDVTAGATDFTLLRRAYNGLVFRDGATSAAVPDHRQTWGKFAGTGVTGFVSGSVLTEAPESSFPGSVCVEHINDYWTPANQNIKVFANDGAGAWTLTVKKIEIRARV